MFKLPITISLSPNTRREDILAAISVLFKPWRWKEGSDIKKTEDWFRNYYQIKEAISFNSGRSALFALLKSFGIGNRDEVLVQSFTCAAVPDPVIWVGAKPVFVDIDENCNIDSTKVESKINKRTRAIIVQHTFGIPANVAILKKISQKHNLILIEDCAHSLGALVNGNKVGSFGDAAFFSFGRDKVLSSVFGGMAFIDNKYEKQRKKLIEFHSKLKYPTYYWILQQLIHPVSFALILPFYNYFLGKVILFIMQKLNLLSFPVMDIEKKGQKPSIFPAKYPNALAHLLLVQLNKLEEYNKTRKKISMYYFSKLKNLPKIKLPLKNKEAIYLRFNILTNKSEKIFSMAKKKGILLGKWYQSVIDPKGVDFSKLGYVSQSCKNAEKIASLSLNLPTYPKMTMKDAEKVAKIIKEYAN